MPHNFMNKVHLGRSGERWVLEKLMMNGWTIAAQNWTSAHSELDLVAWRQDEILFAEVKTRQSKRELLDPSKLMTVRKRRALARGINRFLSQHPEFSEKIVRVFLGLVHFNDNQFSIDWTPIEELVSNYFS